MRLSLTAMMMFRRQSSDRLGLDAWSVLECMNATSVDSNGRQSESRKSAPADRCSLTAGHQRQPHDVIARQLHRRDDARRVGPSLPAKRPMVHAPQRV